MKSLNFTKGTSDVYSETLTLDDLWEKAKRIGRVRVNNNISVNNSLEEVEINFKRSTGSRIDATGRSTDIREAFRLAIEEAIFLKDK